MKNTKQKIEVLYFYQGYYDNNESIMDVGGKLLSDPLFLDKSGNQITNRSNIDNISKVFIGICRPCFRCFIKNNLKNYSEIIFHIYIKGTNYEGVRIGKYVKSFKLCKELTSDNHKDGILINDKYIDKLSKQYNKMKSLYGKKTDIKNTPLLVLEPYKSDYNKTIIFDGVGDPSFRFRYIGSKFTHFNQTQGFLPYREII